MDFVIKFIYTCDGRVPNSGSRDNGNPMANNRGRFVSTKSLALKTQKYIYRVEYSKQFNLGKFYYRNLHYIFYLNKVLSFLILIQYLLECG